LNIDLLEVFTPWRRAASLAGGDSVWIIRKFPFLLRALLVILLPPDRNNLLKAFLLEGHAKNAIAYAPTVNRVEGSPGLLLIKVYKAEADAPPGHDVRGQTDRPDSAEVREQLI
jgi:hypothetical protein